MTAHAADPSSVAVGIRLAAPAARVQVTDRAGARAPARRWRRTRRPRRPAPRSIAERRCQRTEGELADRDRDERAERVVGVGAREHRVVDVLLHREVPAHAEDLDAGIPPRKAAATRPTRCGSTPEHQHRQGHQRARRACPAASGRSSRTRSRIDGHHQQAGGLGGEHEAPALPADRVVGDRRTQGGPGAGVDHVEDAEAEDDDPQPRGRPEEGPALAQLARSCRPACSPARGRDARPGSRRSAASSHVRASTASAQPGADGDHEQGADGGAEDGEAVAGQRDQRVGRLEVLARHQLGQRARHRREPDAAETAPWTDAQHDQHPDLGVTRSGPAAAIAPWVRAEATLENCSTSVRGKPVGDHAA